MEKASVTLVRMSKKEFDPAATTQQFRAFVKRGEDTQSSGGRLNPLLIVGVAGVLLVALIILAVLLMGG